MPPTLLFVYGSLKRAERHHGELRGARFAGEARTRPAYRLLELGGYPVLATGSRGIEGELFEVDAELLAQLDAFEGDDYERVAIELADGRVAQTYAARSELPSGEELDLVRWSGTPAARRI